MKTIEVIFLKNQGAEDIFHSATDIKKLYVRQPCNNKANVCWLTGNKWAGGVEASTPLKADIEIRVISVQDNLNVIHYTETTKELSESDDTFAEKQFPFSYEFYKEKAAEYLSVHSLKTHSEWKEWLLGYKKFFKPETLNDNWLYFYVDTMPSSMRFAKIPYIGKKCYLYKEHCFHRIARLWWNCYTLIDDSGNTLEICGYEILGENEGEMIDG
ncbi:MAG: hypothetical protein IJ341_02145 [Bacteroidales bacterium]|nr:hypothetical protein [Bacteroidales bacterium]